MDTPYRLSTACDLRKNLGAFTCHLASLLPVVDLVRPALRESGDTKLVSKRANMCVQPVLRPLRSADGPN
jgi:hypothetical protein